jgi:hypothetical protein
MKGYQIFFLVLRVLLILQVILVIFKKNILNPEIKLIIDSVLKLGMGTFLYLFFTFNKIPEIEYWDSFILQFAGLIILLDIDYGRLLDILGKYLPFSQIL